MLPASLLLFVHQPLKVPGELHGSPDAMSAACQHSSVLICTNNAEQATGVQTVVKLSNVLPCPVQVRASLHVAPSHSGHLSSHATVPTVLKVANAACHRLVELSGWHAAEGSLI